MPREEDVLDLLDKVTAAKNVIIRTRGDMLQFIKRRLDENADAAAWTRHKQERRKSYKGRKRKKNAQE